MSLWSVFWWLLIGWWLIQVLKYVRQAWQQNPENPTRIFLADFAGLLILLSVFWSVVSYSLLTVMNSDGEAVMRMMTIAAGIGKVERGEFVQVRSSNNDISIVQRLIGLPDDELSIKEGIVHINAIPLGATPEAFLRVDTDCETVTVPPKHFAIMDWSGTKPISCRDMQIRPIKDLQAHCLAVLWPFSQSCRAPTNDIPENWKIVRPEPIKQAHGERKQRARQQRRKKP